MTAAINDKSESYPFADAALMAARAAYKGPDVDGIEACLRRNVRFAERGSTARVNNSADEETTKMANVPMMATTKSQVPAYCGDFAAVRTYDGGVGAILSVAVTDDVTQLLARGWVCLPVYGTTAQRPGLNDAANVGVLYFDTTLSQLLVSDGQVWRNAQTGAAV